MFVKKNNSLNQVSSEISVERLPDPTEIRENDNVMSCLLKGDIYYIYHKPGTLSTVDDMHFLFDRYSDFYKENGAMRVVVEMGPHSSMDKEARELLQAQKEDAICEAVVISSLAQRILINFYFTFNKHTYPSKAFASFKNALEWVDLQ